MKDTLKKEHCDRKRDSPQKILQVLTKIQSYSLQLTLTTPSIHGENFSCLEVVQRWSKVVGYKAWCHLSFMIPWCICWHSIDEIPILSLIEKTPTTLEATWRWSYFSQWMIDIENPSTKTWMTLAMVLSMVTKKRGGPNKGSPWSPYPVMWGGSGMLEWGVNVVCLLETWGQGVLEGCMAVNA